MILKIGSSGEDVKKLQSKLGLKKEAESLALTQLKPFEETPEKRIGYWRAQFLASNESAQRNIWLTKIQTALIISFA